MITELFQSIDTFILNIHTNDAYYYLHLI
jgi:hypothetical protein